MAQTLSLRRAAPWSGIAFALAITGVLSWTKGGPLELTVVALIGAATCLLVALARLFGSSAEHWLKLGIALTALVASVYLFSGFLNPAPVAASFTRVGGPTRVDTAELASLFWSTPPVNGPPVAMARNDSNEAAWKAARCATDLDVPLLIQPAANQNRVYHRYLARLGATNDRTRHADKSCLPSAGASCDGKWSVFRSPNLEAERGILYPKLPAGYFPMCDKLAERVVIVVPQSPDSAPDVAVGISLAAHMARDPHEQSSVSLIIIPRYIEADPALERLLRGQKHRVLGGVVLGQTDVLPEDVRNLSRQLLTGVSGSDLLSQLGANLGALDGLVAAVFAVFGLAAVAQNAPLTIVPAAAPTLVHGGRALRTFAATARKRSGGAMEGRDTNVDPPPTPHELKETVVLPKRRPAREARIDLRTWIAELRGRSAEVHLRSKMVVRGRLDRLVELSEGRILLELTSATVVHDPEGRQPTHGQGPMAPRGQALLLPIDDVAWLTHSEDPETSEPP